MWIIFDLDDTLLQTSEVTTPYCLHKVAEKLAQNRIEQKDFFEDLISLHTASYSSKETLHKFFQKHPAKKKFHFEIAKFLYEDLSKEAPVIPYPEVKKNLFYLAKANTLFIVSKGELPIQLEKLKKAGIDRELFSKIVVSSNEDKMDSYQQIVRMAPMNRAEILAVGDRPVLDLKPAKELGCTTVHIKRGRGKGLESNYHDFIIDHLDQLMDIVNKERGNDGIE